MTRTLIPVCLLLLISLIAKNQQVSPPTTVDFPAPAGIYHIILRFMVSKDGTVSGVKAEFNHGYGMEAEAVRIIKSGPKWTPATQDGKTVNAYRLQPVSFKAHAK